MGREERKEELEMLIQRSLFDEATRMARHPLDYEEGEAFVDITFREENVPQEIIEAALEGFLESRVNRYELHGYWVHSLSHFTDKLWKRGMRSWIKRFNETAFRGVYETGDTNCSDRLVGDFGRYASWDDDSTDFHLTDKILRWMKWDYLGYTKARIQMRVFQSEEEYICWRLGRLEDFMNHVDIEQIQAFLRRLRELGSDVSEFDALPRTILTQRLEEYRRKLEVETEDWRKENLRKKIAGFETNLALL